MELPARRYLELAEKWMDGTITEAEKKEFSDWYSEAMNEELIVDEVETGNRDEVQDRIFRKIEALRGKAAKRKFLGLPRYAAAAILCALIVASFLLVYRKPVRTTASAKTLNTIQDIAAPAISKAVLTFADGRQILLDSAGNGTLATVGATRINKTGGEELVYQGNESPATAPVYNTLSVPRGSRVVSLTLSDGTKVWLNAESSLRFPVVFTSDERRVEVNGEAYFEVAKEKSRRFYVNCGQFTTEVLGTHFNVNSYKDEPLAKVSLLEGSVKVKPAHSAAILLEPGQQAEIGSDAKKSAISDPESVIAWKDGLFAFRNMNIEAIMRQLSRWYNLSVRYEGRLENKHFTGKIGRQESVGEVLNLLELTDVIHFKIKGREVIISP